MRTDRDIMIERWSKALKRIRNAGGPFALLDLPEQVSEILKNTNDLTSKTLMLEEIARALEAGRKA